MGFKIYYDINKRIVEGETNKDDKFLHTEASAN